MNIPCIHKHNSLLCKLNMASVWLVLLLFSSSGFVSSKADEPNFSAYIIFGDSTVDSGNNDFITATTAKADFPPYGTDFPSHIPTGRFSNGKLATDLLYERLGLGETVPAYMDPTLTIHDMLTGVSFASADSGYDNLTCQISGTLPLSSQLEYFREYKTRLAKDVGDGRASDVIRNALYEISMGSNDFIVNYFRTPVRCSQYSVAQYQDFLVDIATAFINEIVKEGASNILVVGLARLGSVPISKTLFPSSETRDKINMASSGFNKKLMDRIHGLGNVSPTVRFYFVDSYMLMSKILAEPASYGFEESERGCCGSGMMEVGETCNWLVPLCPDASKYVFWDAVHPTQAYYQIVSDLIYHMLSLNIN